MIEPAHKTEAIHATIIGVMILFQLSALTRLQMFHVKHVQSCRSNIYQKNKHIPLYDERIARPQILHLFAQFRPQILIGTMPGAMEGVILTGKFA